MMTRSKVKKPTPRKTARKPIPKKTARKPVAKKRAIVGRESTKATPSAITRMVHSTAKDLFAVGAIDQATMREFDALCLPKVPNYTAKQIKDLRNRNKCSQPVFAAYLNVTPSSLKQWESGAKKPAAAARKLLNVVERKGLNALC
jgi:putative transcriptional regulator